MTPAPYKGEALTEDELRPFRRRAADRISRRQGHLVALGRRTARTGTPAPKASAALIGVEVSQLQRQGVAA